MKIEIELKKDMIHGTKVILQDEEIIRVHKFFEKECMSEYVSENNTDWSDEKIEFVSNRAYEICDENVSGEDEQYAIQKAIEEWEKRHG